MDVKLVQKNVGPSYGSKGGLPVGTRKRVDDQLQVEGGLTTEQKKTQIQFVS